ncbi:hypothetical protein PHMEG_0002516 [Phytophthora megakarya]|uniref:Reverse transcriptase domain-containing protein n=1 Tax=Phytophthora megakarya TaxID=4795 RepID=A0A225WYH6_9STRA|nr:hypothetical protein PHMEG_0002516 [Phytophthora megakarya]
MQKVLAPLIPHSNLLWVNDVISCAPTVEEFVQVLRQFFLIVAKTRLKLNKAKTKIFKVELLWFGRLFSDACVRHDQHESTHYPNSIFPQQS